MNNEHPILMSTPMVQAYMAGRKNQTRRLTGLDEINKEPDNWELVNWPAENAMVFKRKGCDSVIFVKLPYGPVGGKLWFRESWTIPYLHDGGEEDYYYKADNIKVSDFRHRFIDGKWRPSIHMPRAAARFMPKILGYKLERLQNISKQDAINEGIEKKECKAGHTVFYGYKIYTSESSFTDSPIESYKSLWDLLNSKPKKTKSGKIKPAYPWFSNPWVWAVEFERFEATPFS